MVQIWKVSWNKNLYDYKRLIKDYLNGNAEFIYQPKGIAHMINMPKINDIVFISCNKKKIMKCIVISEFATYTKEINDKYNIYTNKNRSHSNNFTYLKIKICEIYKNPEILKGNQRTWSKYNNLEKELQLLDDELNKEINNIKNKYASLKKNIISKYKVENNTKKNRKSIPKSLKNQVWNNKIGKQKGVGECNVCKIEIDSKNFECGHIISVHNGGENILENLIPICNCCNKSMRTENLNEFKNTYFTKK